MTGISVLCSDIDEEDIKYLRQSLQVSYFQSRPFNLYNLRVTGCLQSQLNLPTQIELCSNRSDQTATCSHSGDSNLRSDENSSENRCSVVPSSVTLKHHYGPSKLFEDIVRRGVDEEDASYLKTSYRELGCDSKQKYWTNKVRWIDHPLTDSDGVGLERPASCARTEPWTKAIKKVMPQLRSSQEECQQLLDSQNCSNTSPYGKNYNALKKTASRDARNDQRRMSTAYESITESNLLKLNNLKFRKKKLRLGKSKIHGLGIFAMENIQSNDIIIEYVGQIIRPIIAELREKKYKSSGIGSYCFKVDDNTILDATKHGNLNRFINHSCDANSYTKVLMINNKKKIVIYSKRFIKKGEEITFDYKLPIEQDKIPCLCKAPNCRKALN